MDNPHEYIAELKTTGQAVNLSPKTIKFSDGTIFTYNKDKPISKALSTHLDIFGKYNSKELNKKIKNYIRNNIENQTFDKTISRDFVMKKMKDDGIISSMIVRETPRDAYLYMLNVVFKKNATHYQMKDIEAMLNKGKNLYNISFRARVRYNEDGEVKHAIEEKSGQFRSDKPFEKVNNWKTAQNICHLYYF